MSDPKQYAASIHLSANMLCAWDLITEDEHDQIEEILDRAMERLEIGEGSDPFK